LEFNVPFQHKYGYIRDDEVMFCCSEKGRLISHQMNVRVAGKTV